MHLCRFCAIMELRHKLLEANTLMRLLWNNFQANAQKGYGMMKNEYTITKKEMMSWAKEYHIRGAKAVFFFILWCVLGVCGIFITIAAILSESKNWVAFSLGGLYLVASVYQLFFSRFVHYSRRYKLYSRFYGATEWQRTIEFTDDEIVITDHTSVTKLLYSNVKKIIEKNNVAIIIFKNNIAIRLYKGTFTEGTWEECKEKINTLM